MNFSTLRAISTNQNLLRYVLRLLRHTPEAAGLLMDADGWVEKSELLAAVQCARADCLNWSLNDLDLFLSQHNEFQRFALDATRCRASYGHSTVNYRPYTLMPLPAPVFHGTCESNLEEIRKSGLLPMGRLCVQMTTSYEYAVSVANQHEFPVVLLITPGLHAAGLYGHPTGSHVWLSRFVPPVCVSLVSYVSPKVPKTR